MEIRPEGIPQNLAIVKITEFYFAPINRDKPEDERFEEENIGAEESNGKEGGKDEEKRKLKKRQLCEGEKRDE